MKINFASFKGLASRVFANKTKTVTVQKTLGTVASKPVQITQPASTVKQTVKIVGQTAAKPAAKSANESKELFCHKYWRKRVEQGELRDSYKKNVPHHSSLNGINNFFISHPYPKYMDEVISSDISLTPRQMISETDAAFKCLRPTDKPFSVFRAIGKKPEFFSEYPLYQKRCAIKKGDVIDMKEYAYATSDLGYANVYLPNNQGILYEINVPAGAKVSRTGDNITNEVVFPRSSKFVCKDVKNVKDADNDYLHVTLDYIIPQG